MTAPVGGFIPEFSFLIEGPGMMMSSNALRIGHRAISKSAAKTTMQKHKLTRLKSHFKAGNWNKYEHMPRKQKYLQEKRKKGFSPIDLVKRGKTKRWMEGQYPNIRIGGTADTNLKVRLFLSYPFPVTAATDNKPGSVTIDQMSTEVATWNHNDVKDAARDYQHFYVEELERWLATRPRHRARISPQLGIVKTNL